MSRSSATPQDVATYDAAPILEQMRHSKSPERREQEVGNLLKLLNRFRPLDASSRIMEIGAGMGWFQVLCRRRGIPCEGIELTPIFVEAANQLAAQFGVEPSIQLANIETTDIGENLFDAVIAESVLEHTPDWQNVIRKAYRALKPGGVFYMVSSNKFSLFCGDFPGVPFYSWLPDRVRYWIRQKTDGPEIMFWGVDSNQFRYPSLKKFLLSVGFARALDYIDIKDSDSLNHPTRTHRFVLAMAKRSKLAKWLLLTFWTATVFVCQKGSAEGAECRDKSDTWGDVRFWNMLAD
jgi:SAM-dependent methyltransferase